MVLLQKCIEAKEEKDCFWSETNVSITETNMATL